MKLSEQSWNWDKVPTTTQSNSNTETTKPGTRISDSDFEKFKTLLAQKLNFNLTDQKHMFLNAFRQAENTNASNNPFATTLNYKNDPDMTKFNLANKGQGVKNFSTVEYGADATAITLKLRYYTTLVNQLRNDDITAAELAANPELKTWGTGGLIAKILNSKKLTDKKTNTVTTPDDSWKMILKYNDIVLEAVYDMYKVITKTPDIYFNDFKRWYDDDEEQAAQWLKTAYTNGWLRNIKHPDKSLLKINQKLIEIHKQFTDKKYFSDVSTDYIAAGPVYVQINIKTLTAVVNEIVKLIKAGKQNTVTAKFYRYVNNKWKEQTVRFKWDYM